MLYDVVIIGGGVIGTAIARELSKYHLKIALLEKHVEVGFETSKSNSGIIHAGHHAPTGTVKGQLEWSGNQMWGELHKNLGFGFRHSGEITIAFTPEQVQKLHKLYAQGEQRGVTGLELWDGDQVRAVEPNLSTDIIAGLYAPTSGVIEPYQAVFRLCESAQRNGLHLFTRQTVTDITELGGGFEIETQRDHFYARFVINAAGLFADEITNMVGLNDFKITPRKGEEYLLDGRLRGLVKHTIFPVGDKVTKGVLVIPTYGGTIMVGPTAIDIDDKLDYSTTAEGAAAVFSQVRQVCPGISERDCIAQFAGLRPAGTGGDFIIGTTDVPGFINVAGMQSPGLTAAPAIAAMVTDILDSEGLDMVETTDFIPDLPETTRFADLSTEEQIKISRSDPAYAHIICRCELISRAEIEEAMHQGAVTLDGLKFRTRAGMGRCQGRVCTAPCMSLLAQAQGVPMQEVTKRGEGSWMIIEREQVRRGKEVTI